jgi:NAD-dependent dihydropyrimidine dehydrogenase PreA subunit
MAYTITAPCVDVKDQACVEVCPVDCIHYEESVDRTLFIDPNECIDCGACEPVCPTEAIFANDAVPEDQKPWIEVNALWYTDKDAARAKVSELKPPA